MLEITCVGSPFEIGWKIGTEAGHLIKGSIAFYRGYFRRHSNMEWEEAEKIASEFLPVIDMHADHLIKEMQGMAAAAGVPFLSILALNARTEIAMGLMNDGCTSLAYKSGDVLAAGQNWDWDEAQKARLILLHIKDNVDLAYPPTISQVTEAGIVGKIGINSAGLGVFLNAIVTKGIDKHSFPVHIALRVALEAPNKKNALIKLRNLGYGAAGHILVADAESATSLEFSSSDSFEIEMHNGRIAHTNHFLVENEVKNGLNEKLEIIDDSRARMARAIHLLDEAREEEKENPTSPVDILKRVLCDNDGYPRSINRDRHGTSEMATLFSIVADLSKGTATVKFGRPDGDGEVWNLDPKAIHDAPENKARYDGLVCVPVPDSFAAAAATENPEAKD